MSAQYFLEFVLPSIALNLFRQYNQTDKRFSTPPIVASIISTSVVSLLSGFDKVQLLLYLLFTYPFFLTLGAVTAGMMLFFFIFPQNKLALSVFMIAQGLMGCFDFLLWSNWVLVLNLFWYACVVRFKKTENQSQYEVVPGSDMKQMVEQKDMKKPNDNNV